jgi:hypothetical protein
MVGDSTLSSIIMCLKSTKLFVPTLGSTELSLHAGLWLAQWGKGKEDKNMGERCNNKLKCSCNRRDSGGIATDLMENISLSLL